MAFDKSQLESDLKDIFFTMKKESKDDDWFAEELSKAVKDFGESGDIVTVDTGTVSSGTFTGSGQGSLSLTDSIMSAPIKACCALMKQGLGDDTTLANAIGNGMLLMTTSGKAETDVVGTTISPVGVVVPPASGTAEGTITCQNATLIAGLILCFQSMKTKYKDEGFNGDEYFASQMATLTDGYFKAGVIATSGQGVLSGTVGTGSIS